MKKNKLLLFTLLLTWFAAAQEAITLSGTVADPLGAAVAGAIVTVHNQSEYSAVTDASGNFSISSVAVRVPRSRTFGVANGAVLKGNNLYVANSATGAVKLDLFTVAGRNVISHTIEKLSGSAYSFSLPLVAEGLYVLKVTVNGKVSSFKQFFSADLKLSVEKQELSGTQGGSVAKISAFTSDSLVAMATGFMPVYLPLTAYTGSALQIKFETATAQWQPAAGTVEHVGSMVKIRAAGTSFAMGQPVVAVDENGPWKIEQPTHQVSFTYDFFIDSTEVTQKLYTDVMSDVPGFAASDGWNATYGIGDNVAAHHMSISDAILFCNARSNKEGLDTVYTWESLDGTPGRKSTLAGINIDCTKKGYRLPTEAEWEYACRGGSVTDFYWKKNLGSYPSTAADSAEFSTYALWYANSGSLINTDPKYGVKPGVASRLPNSYGLFDMIGSCMEWVHVSYFRFSADAKTDPKPDGVQDISDPTVISPRGGNFDNHPINLRSSARKPRVGNYPYCYWGFRSVKEAQ